MLAWMKILNLGCGTRTSAHPDVINVDWSIYLRLKKNAVLRALVPFVVSGERLERFKALPPNIVVHNLARGIPFESDSIDLVYHSHLLEHLDQDVAARFVREVARVLKPGGIHRVVVPDLEVACRKYLAHVDRCAEDPHEAPLHDSYVEAIIEQSVRREARGTSQQPPARRFVENVILGDARQQGDTHQWMYDRVNLAVLMTNAGFEEPKIRDYSSSGIPGWSQYRLDIDGDGNEYKPGSLYMEFRK